MSARGAGRGIRTPGRAAGAVRPARSPTRVRPRRSTPQNPAISATQPEPPPLPPTPDHRPGTKELECAALTVGEVAEAAAVLVPGPRGERRVEMYVSLKARGAEGPEGADAEPGEDAADRVTAAIEREIGTAASPENVWIVPDLPKTRTGEIIRAILAGVSNFTEFGDTSTLANPETVENIRRHVQGTKLQRGETPPNLTPQQIEEIRTFGD